MDKMDGKSKDIVAENIGKLKELFPEAFTEGKVDFDILKEVLGKFVDKCDERFSFTWNGKSKARMIAQMPSTGTLRPCKEESADWDTTQNIFIEGDNLEVLKLLQRSYHKKVKMIYIDPPYNTGKDFVYKDNFKDNIKNYKIITGQVDDKGRNLSSNPETSGRYHTDWLNMMYPRLMLARNLLKDDGVIFISIDDNEQANLKKLCDEIFGEENFLGTIIHQRAKGGGQAKYLVKGHDYIHVYARDLGKKIVLRRKKVIQNKVVKRNGKSFLIEDDLIRKTFGKYDKSLGDRRCFYEQLEEYKGVDKKRKIDALIKQGLYFLQKNKDGMHTICRYVPIEEASSKLYSIVKVLSEKGIIDLENLNLKGFTYPKPVELIKSLIEAVTLNSTERHLILDFFAGSATSAHAIIKLNSEDNANRRFIMVQLPEATDKKLEAYNLGYKTIAQISKERIRRAATKINEENPDYDGDLGFKVFKLDSTNIRPWEADYDSLNDGFITRMVGNIKKNRSDEDVLYEVLLKCGLDLTLPITEHVVAGQKVFDIGMGALLVCLSDTISLEVASGIAKLKDELNPEIMRVVFIDSAFKDDMVKTNAIQILNLAGIDVRSL